MSDKQESTPPDNLQFDKAIYKDAAVHQSACAICKLALPGSYYNINGAVACPDCKNRLESEFTSRNSAGGIFKALAFGIPAAILGAVIYYAILALSGYEIGLVAILIGWMVGAAVHQGSGRRGGLAFQIVAAVLTYVAICSTYIPAILRASVQYQQTGQTSPQPVSLRLNRDFVLGAREAQAADTQHEKMEGSNTLLVNEKNITFFEYLIGFGMIFLLALAAPFLGGFQNIIGILIVGFGVWEAWKMNKKIVFHIQGPFQIKGSA
jgi:uncharacterized membrane protein